MVGERFYGPHIAKIYKKRGVTDSCERCCVWATLIPEPENKHDSNAVALYADGLRVGHLPSEIAEVVQAPLLNLYRKARLHVAISGFFIHLENWQLFLDATMFDLETLLSEPVQALPFKERHRTGIMLTKALVYACATMAAIVISWMIVQMVINGVSAGFDWLMSAIDIAWDYITAMF